MDGSSPAKERIVELRWHGRGGQGAITCAQILAEAAYYEGYEGVSAAPYFGAERRGAPVIATTRLSRQPIRTCSEVENPDVVVVLDETLFTTIDVTQGLKPGGYLIINSARPPLGIDGRFNVATTDATAVSLELGLMVAGVVVVNTPILGAFLKATGLLSAESIWHAIQVRFSPLDAEKNFAAVKLALERTLLAPRR
jgi:pyruvate ferredoxin oxidoreductase gamma subunit